jgi:O-antigen ligase
VTVLLTIFRLAATGLAWFGAAVLFVLSPAIGSIASILAIVVTILISPAAMPPGFWSRPDWRRALPLVIFVVLGICLVAEAVLVLFGAWTTGMTAVELTLVVLLVASLAVLPASWHALRRQPAMLMFLAAFVSLTICFIATAQQPGDVLFSTNFLGLLLAPAIYLLALRRPGSRTIAIVATLLALGAIVGALVGSYDVFIQHKERAIGWGAGGNLMARAVVPLGFMALGGVLALRSHWRWLLVFGTVASLYALYLTGTRGVFVAVPVLGLLFVWALMRELHAKRIWYVAGLVLLVVATGAIGVFSPRFLALGSVLEQLMGNTAVPQDYATIQRLQMWQAGWSALLRAPLIGHGWAHLSDAAKPYVLSMYHNDFFNAAVAAGVVGIIAWLATILAPIAGILVMPRDRFSNLRLYCALLLSLSFFIFGLTDMTFGYDLPTTLHAFLTAIVLGAFREPETVEVNRAG